MTNLSQFVQDCPNVKTESPMSWELLQLQVTGTSGLLTFYCCIVHYYKFNNLKPYTYLLYLGFFKPEVRACLSCESSTQGITLLQSRFWVRWFFIYRLNWRIYLVTYSSASQNSFPCCCRTEVLILLLVVSQRLLSIPGGHQQIHAMEISPLFFLKLGSSFLPI